MIKVHELTKIYPGPVPALRGVSLEIGTGMFGLLGPNGAGKSTFMNILAGLMEPTAGSAELHGQDIIRQPDRIRGQLGYLPQEFGFYDHLTGRAMLKYLLKLKGVNGAAGLNQLVDQLLEVFPRTVDVSRLMNYLERQEVAEGTVLIRQGDQSEDLYFIESGQVTARLEMDGGEKS